MDIHSQVEKIFTSALNIPALLEQNSNKLDEINLKLHQIIETGYFGILNSAESILTLCKADKFSVTLPGALSFPRYSSPAIEIDIEDEAWSLINADQFFRSVQLCLSDPSLSLLLLYLSDTSSFPLFVSPKSLLLDRLAGFALLLQSDTYLETLAEVKKDNISDSLSCLWIRELSLNLLKLQNKQDFSGILNCLELSIEVLDDIFLSQNLKQYLNIEISPPANIQQISAMYLDPIVPTLKESIGEYVKNTDSISSLMSVIDFKECKYGIPTMFSMIKDSWILKCKEVIPRSLKINVESRDAMGDFETDTAECCELLNLIKDNFEEYSEVNQSISTIFLQNIDNLSVSDLFKANFLSKLETSSFGKFVYCDEYKQKTDSYLESWIQSIERRSIIDVCKELVDVAGGSNQFLEGKIDMKFGTNERVLGELLGGHVQEERKEIQQLPSSLPKIETLKLPSRFLPHLV